VDLGVSSEKVPGGWVVDVSGEVDLHTAPQVRAALDAAVGEVVADPACRAVLVDLTAVTFMDSTGLGELVGAHKAVQRGGGRLHLAVGNDRVARLLALTGLDEVLEVHPDRDTALATLAAQA
jgi:anti-sigma B factor antagonist